MPTVAARVNNRTPASSWKRAGRSIWARTTGLALATVLLTGAAQSPSVTAEKRGSEVVSRFMAAVRACGIDPGKSPALVVKSDPPFMYYNGQDKTVHISRWEEIPAPLQDFLRAWSKQSTLELDPPAMFSEIFNSLLVSHELGHHLQWLSGRNRTLDKWQLETEANQIAIAFWSMAPEGDAPIATRVTNFQRFLGNLPNPVPAGTDAHAYFEANYEQQGSNPAAYGWYQGAFMRTAWANRQERDFCGWVKLNTPKNDPSDVPAAK